MAASLRGTFSWLEKQLLRKQTFVQNLGKNNLFGDISEVYWISKITLSEERESAIRDKELVIKNCILTIQRTWKILII